MGKDRPSVMTTNRLWSDPFAVPKKSKDVNIYGGEKRVSARKTHSPPDVSRATTSTAAKMIVSS
jgi:hypothetical protein